MQDALAGGEVSRDRNPSPLAGEGGPKGRMTGIERSEMAPIVRHVAQPLDAPQTCAKFLEVSGIPRSHLAPLDPLIRHCFAMTPSPARGKGARPAYLFSSLAPAAFGRVSGNPKA